ncbi:hypothetical protein FOMG_19596 [Fusarium oxysporum f. sp. melonis 26406]|uniref:Uncharacterized protein n=1 Tax=Fusarium oxysporum f. sp. melonis 26406 TaxID=1089452 RepID=W9Z5V5_FUSOX|nr:hypothetical protein FOMG_19596 [Fusarium oxysporum f. sp. melonis 26406]
MVLSRRLRESSVTSGVKMASRSFLAVFKHGVCQLVQVSCYRCCRSFSIELRSGLNESLQRETRTNKLQILEKL